MSGEDGPQPGDIRVHVRLFAMQRELAGTRGLDLALAEGSTIEDAWAALVGRFPVLAPGRPAVRFARNGSYSPAATPLDDGDELAMIPPVSGGSSEPPASGGASEPRGGGAAEPRAGGGAESEARFRILELREEPFDAAILADLGRRLATPEDGAVVGFLGVTRRSPGTPAAGQEAEAARHSGRVVEALSYEVHPQMALAILSEIADEVEARFGVRRIAIVHREGEVPLGEPSVAIVTCAPHRDAAFEAARYAIDETKARAPIWKAERFADGHVWIGEPAREAPNSEA